VLQTEPYNSFLRAPAKLWPSSGEVTPGAAVHRRTSACKPPGPSDPRSTNQIAYPFALSDRCTVHPWTRSTVRSTAAPAARSVMDGLDRPQPLVNRVTAALSRARHVRVRSGADGLDPAPPMSNRLNTG
jgi:hypothetical protein